MTKIKPTIAADVARFVADSEKAAAERAKAARAEARAKEAARVRFTREDLEGAVLVKFKWGWRRVKSINTTTVSYVESWYRDALVLRAQFSSVLDFKTAPNSTREVAE